MDVETRRTAAATRRNDGHRLPSALQVARETELKPFGGTQLERDARGVRQATEARGQFKLYQSAQPLYVPTELSDAELTQEAIDIFRELDAGGSGSIDLKELHDALRELNLPSTMGQAREIMEKYDTDASGRLSKKDFTELVKEMRAGRVKKDGRRVGMRTSKVSKQLDASELAELLGELDEGMGEDEFEGEDAENELLDA